MTENIVGFHSTHHHFVVELPRRGYVFHSHGHVSGLIARGARSKRYAMPLSYYYG